MRSGGLFRQAWLTETLRLREAHWGPLQDATELRRARAEGGSFAERIALRATFLARREKIDQAVQQWVLIARLSLFAMLAVATLAGIGTGLGALGDGTRAVNVVLAWLAALGLHLLTLLLWLVGVCLQPSGQGAWLGKLWLDATRKLARGPDAALAPRALIGLLGRHGGLRWTLSAVSHILWLTALIALLATLLAMLSARRYTFNWETTLLTPDAFVGLTQALGWLPSKLGFAMPPESIIRLSDGLNALPSDAHALWSSWLLGCVVVYGVLPRLAALVISAWLARSGVRKASIIDTSLPGLSNLRPRLMPSSEGIAPDAPAGANIVAKIEAAPSIRFTDAPLIVGLELADNIQWPPAALPEGVQNGGVIDSRAQRHHLLDQLHAQPVPRMLVVCDSHQTPDRGALAFIAELASYAGETRVAFIRDDKQPPGDDARLQAWRRQLDNAGVPAERQHAHAASALNWLRGEGQHA